jgi:hypothetical protein
VNKSFSKLYLVPLTVLVLAGFAVSAADAAGGRAGGGGGGGGGARAGSTSSGGGGAKQSAQPNNSRADSRSNDVRSTSVNNTNINASKDVNVNVNVDQHGGVGGWDHPVAGAMVVGGAIAVTAAALGSTVAAVPVGCVPVNYSGMIYQQCGGTWYAPQGSQFVVVNAPY